MVISETEAPRRPSASAGPIPNRLGRYDVIDRLAVGGMAEVFVCYERGLGGLERLAVVKRILPQLAAKESFVTMFLAEARYVARLNHPNVVQVFELAEDEHGTPFLSMEYIAGNSVREMIVSALEHQQRTPVGAVVGIVVQACAGAHAAHELTDPTGQPLGLVHRDISPHNLMVTADGHVKLLDFGIAKATAAATLDDQTATGGLKGKIHYMSPEQIKQEPLDRRTDVFALAIVLWETLASGRLFRRGNELEAMHAIIDGERKDLREVRDDVPDEIHHILAKALSPEKQDRFATSDEMRKALLDACAVHGLSCGPDDVAAFVRPLLGESQRSKEADLLQRARGERGAQLLGPTAAPDAATSPPHQAPGATRVLDPPAHVKSVAERIPFKALVVTLSVLGLVLGIVMGGADTLFGPSGAPMSLAFPPTADSALMLEDMEPLRAWLEESLDRPVSISIAKSYQDLQGLVLRGELDVAALPPYLYVETLQKEPALEIIATKMVQGSTGNDSILYVADTSGITDITQLAGKRLCFPDKKSTTGYLFPRLALRRAGLDPDVDVESHRSGSHMQALRDVVAGVCDATATYSGGFLAADRAGIPVARMRQLAIIARSPHTAIVVPKHVPDAERSRIQKAFLSYDPSDGGKSGRVERISGFEPPDREAYEAVREALLDEL